MRLLTRFPLLVLAGGGLLGYIAGEMMVEDPAVAPWIAAHTPQLTAFAPGVGVALVVAVGWGLTRRRGRAHKT